MKFLFGLMVSLTTFGAFADNADWSYVENGIVCESASEVEDASDHLNLKLARFEKNGEAIINVADEKGNTSHRKIREPYKVASLSISQAGNGVPANKVCVTISKDKNKP